MTNLVMIEMRLYSHLLGIFRRPDDGLDDEGVPRVGDAGEAAVDEDRQAAPVQIFTYDFRSTRRRYQQRLGASI